MKLKRTVKKFLFIMRHGSFQLKKPKLIRGSFSQAGQESMAAYFSDYSNFGCYLEVGSGHPKQINNTYLLETHYQWKGLGVELNPELVSNYRELRKNPVVLADATNLNYLELLRNHDFPNRIDFLQIDIDPSSQSLAALKALPLDEYRFSVITFEHDLYKNSSNESIADESREILQKEGYCLIFKNVKFLNGAFEDWYVDPAVVSAKKIKDFKNNNIEYWKNFRLLF